MSVHPDEPAIRAVLDTYADRVTGFAFDNHGGTLSVVIYFKDPNMRWTIAKAVRAVTKLPILGYIKNDNSDNRFTDR